MPLHLVSPQLFPVSIVIPLQPPISRISCDCAGHVYPKCTGHFIPSSHLQPRACIQEEPHICIATRPPAVWLASMYSPGIEPWPHAWEPFVLTTRLSRQVIQQVLQGTLRQGTQGKVWRHLLHSKSISTDRMWDSPWVFFVGGRMGSNSLESVGSKRPGSSKGK